MVIVVEAVVEEYEGGEPNKPRDATASQERIFFTFLFLQKEIN